VSGSELPLQLIGLTVKLGIGLVAGSEFDPPGLSGYQQRLDIHIAEVRRHP